MTTISSVGLGIFSLVAIQVLSLPFGTIDKVVFLQEDQVPFPTRGAGPCTGDSLPECAGCSFSNNVTQERTQPPGNICYSELLIMYDVQKHTCKRYACSNNKHYYEDLGWAWIGCDWHESFADGICPNSNCTP